MTKEEFESYVRTIVPTNSLVIVEFPEDASEAEKEALNHSLTYLSESLLPWGIVFTACPSNLKIHIVPAGLKVVSLDDETSEKNPESKSG